MDIQFSKLTENPNHFFEILPIEWQNFIAPNWNLYKKDASIYVIKDGNEIIAGGIAFSEKTNEMTPFENLFKYLFKEGYLYLGYLWVAEKHRNKKLATKWLSYLKTQNPSQKYWLTIEEEGLKHFYEKNDFKLIAESEDTDSKEWILTYTP